MQPESVTTTVDYYTPKPMPTLAQQLGMSEPQVQQFLGQQFPAMAQLFQGLPQMGTDWPVQRPSRPSVGGRNASPHDAAHAGVEGEGRRRTPR